MDKKEKTALLTKFGRSYRTALKNEARKDKIAILYSVLSNNSKSTEKKAARQWFRLSDGYKYIMLLAGERNLWKDEFLTYIDGEIPVNKFKDFLFDLYITKLQKEASK
jgi:hypothetical protein